LPTPVNIQFYAAENNVKRILPHAVNQSSMHEDRTGSAETVFSAAKHLTAPQKHMNLTV
jgi:hypothetical protein